MGSFKDHVFNEDKLSVKLLINSIFEARKEKAKGSSESVRQGKILKYLNSLGGYWIKVISANRSGVSDIIGGHSIEVTQDMVGSRVAVLCSFEVKDGIGNPSDLQLHHLSEVKDAGGIAAVVRSVEDVKETLASL